MQNSHTARRRKAAWLLAGLLSCAAGATVVGTVGGAAGVSSAVSAPVVVLSGAPSSATKPVVTSVAGTKPTTAPAAPATGFLGINLSPVAYYSGDRQFMNLLVGAGWQDSTQAGWPYLTAAQLDRSGNVTALKPGQKVSRMMTPTADVLSGVGATIRCSWTGTGTVKIFGQKSGKDVPGDHSIQFVMPGGGWTWLELSATSASDPVRNLDCREANADHQAVFAPEFLASLRPFSILRFLDWDGVNENPKDPQWLDRTPEAGLDQRTVAWEHMAKLARTLDADAWYNVPYDAKEDYVVRMGRLIHDLTPAGRKVYVELSNEVWNTGFNATRQAQQEGIAERLDANPARATLLRYAEKSSWLMKLWTPIFADRPGQLVRVVATQNVSNSAADQILGFRDTAQWVDALATAPYFGYSLLQSNASTDAGALMPLLAADAAKQLATYAANNATIAKRYGKRYIAYEAGQGMFDYGKTDRLTALNRDPRMYDVYRNYVADWKARFGDTLMLYQSVRGVTGGGAWGLRERAGQPLAEAPKYRAAVSFGR